MSATEPPWRTCRDFDKIGIGDSCRSRSDINEPRTTSGRAEGDADHPEGQGGAARHAQEARGDGRSRQPAPVRHPARRDDPQLRVPAEANPGQAEPVPETKEPGDI